MAISVYSAIKERRGGMMDPQPFQESPTRPDSEGSTARGALTIFLGPAPGVGKTLAMLQAALRRRGAGVDVVVGCVNARGPELDQALEGLEHLPRRLPASSSCPTAPFDLDAALARRPALLILDDLASVNEPASRHLRRWQDVEELLDAGIGVFSTLNVYELESLRDVISRITEVPVEETVPDRLVEQAEELILVDLPVTELRERLAAIRRNGGALPRPLRPGDLMALRELALRRTADHVDARMRRYMHDEAIRAIWPVSERVLTCVSQSPHAVRVVRAAKRFADALHAQWIVAYVQTPSHQHLPERDQGQIASTLGLAQQLGAETVTLSGLNVTEEILRYARQRNVSKIVIGKPKRLTWKRLTAGSITDTLVQSSGDTDVYVISGEEPSHVPYVAAPQPRSRRWPRYLQALAFVAISTVVASVIHPQFERSTLIMVYLLGVVGVAMRCGHGPSVLAAILSVGAFDFFFVHPYFSFAVSDTQYLLTFAVMLLVGLIISGLTVRTRWQAETARERERRTAALYALSQELASARSRDLVLAAAARHLREVIRGRVTALLADGPARLQVQPHTVADFELGPDGMQIAQWAHEHREAAGLGTDTHTSATGLYLPLVAAGRSLGVLALLPDDPKMFEEPAHRLQLETFATQTALALERARLVEEAQAVQVRMETERLRSSLLSSVSHDLRTPLSAITGAASVLLQTGPSLAASDQHDLLETIREEADRLGRLVQNLLDMTRLESGAVRVRKEWHPLEEIVGAALGRLAARLGDRRVDVRLPEDLPLVPIDDVLIQQVLINLLDNALKYTPAGSSIDISARVDKGGVVVEVADRGAGLAPGTEERVFEKFYQGQAPGRGSGLGLAICRGFVEVHDGRIWAENRPDGGAAFRFIIPLAEAPPAVKDTDA